MAEIEGLGLAPDRERYKISQRGAVELRVGYVFEDFNPEAPVEGWFCCMTCNDNMSFAEDRMLFECPMCGYTLSRIEALEMCVENVEHINKLASSITPPRESKKKRRWYFLWLW